MYIVENHISDQPINRGTPSYFLKITGLIILISLASTISIAESRQITLSEDFEDGDLTQNPAWFGDLDDFRFVQENGNQLLRLDSEEGGHSIIYTESETAFGSWEFYYRPEVGPSNNNRTFFILMSDSDDLNIIGSNATSGMNGYALRTGDNSSHRSFKLGRVINGDFQSNLITETETAIMEGIGYQIRVERSYEGDWQIFVGEGYGSTPVADSEIGNDETFDSSNYFGMLVIYSNPNRDKFYYDDIIIKTASDEPDPGGSDDSDDSDPDPDPDEEPEELMVLEIDVIRADQLLISFNQPLDESTVYSTHFEVNKEVGEPQSAELDGEQNVILQFNDTLEDGDYELLIHSVESISGSSLSPDGMFPFTVLNSFTIESITALNSKNIEVEFSERPYSSDIQAEYFILHSANGVTLQPESIDINPASDGLNIILNFSSTLSSGGYMLDINHLYSEFGWPLMVKDEFTFEIINPFYVSDFTILNRNSMEIMFTEPIGDGADDLSNYFIEPLGHPVLAEIPAGEDHTVFLQFEGLMNEGYYEFTLHGLESVNDWILDEATMFTFTLENSFKLLSVEIGSPNTVHVNLSESPDPAGILIDNFMIENLGHPIGWDHSTDSNTITLEFEEPFFSGQYDLVIHNLTNNFGWPLMVESDENYQFEVINPFYLFEVQQSGTNSLELEFSLNIDIESISSEDILLSVVGNPSETELIDLDVLMVIFESELPAGEYDLTIEGIKSLDGWQIEPDTIVPITVFDLYEAGDLVISEFYYRVPVSWRTETFDRPQYIELYNRSDKHLNLRNYRVTGHNISINRDLPIDPGEYLVITRGKPVFVNRFGERNFVEADEFPRLNLTTSDRILLESNDGETIEDLTYVASEWGGNSVSLERLSFDQDAAHRGNWAESRDALTGSPGLPNTVSIPDGAPVALAVETPEPRSIHVLFSREIDKNSALDLTNLSLGSETDIHSAIVDDSGLYLIIRTEDPLIHGTLYTFNYTGVEDLFGNRLDEIREIEFTFMNPFHVSDIHLSRPNTLRILFSMPFEFDTVIADRFNLTDGTSPVQLEIINSTTVELTFHDNFEPGSYSIGIQDITGFDPELSEQWVIEKNTVLTFYRFEEMQAGDLKLNEFMYRPPAEIPRYVEIYNRSNRFLNLRNVELRRRPGSINNGGAISETDLPIEPGGFIVITENKTLLEESYGEGPWFEMSGYPGFTLTSADQIRLIDSNGEVLQQLEYNPPDWGGNGVSLERKSAGAPVHHIFNWAPSIAEQLGTPGMENSVEPDGSVPELLGVQILDEKTLKVTFDGAVYLEMVEKTNFQMSGGISIDHLELIDWRELELHLSAFLTSRQTYTLTVRNIPDIFGNNLESAQQSFTYFRVESAEPGDVVINEFMYNEPDDYTRYVELFNRSNKIIDLAGWQQANDTGIRRTLIHESILLQPGAYVVIAPNEDLHEHFLEIPLIDAGSRLSALKNGGDAIVLFNEMGTVIDSLSYTPAWGGDGVSLERRRADLPGIHRENWGESPAMLLGTPGAENEVESQFVLQADNISSLSREIVKLHFNGPVMESSLHSSNFRVDEHQPAEAILLDEATVRLEFGQPLDAGEHRLQIISLETPAGFTVDTDTTYLFTVYDEFVLGDVIINEFMYRPPSGYPRYVELYNVSDKLLNLQNWRLQRRQNATGSNGLITEEMPLEPGEYLVLTEDSAQLQTIFGEGNYLELSGFPGFALTVADQIRIMAADGSTADSLEYVPSSWGGNGLSLERLSRIAPTHLVENWAESEHPLLGTPGAPNSVEADMNPPQLLAVHQNGNTGFILRFDKRPDQESALNLSNYAFHPNLDIEKSIPDGHTIQLSIANEMENERVYELTVSHIRDIFGNEMDPVTVTIHFLELSESTFNEIVINEILYRRAQSGSPQFIEVYNRSAHNFDLSGWTLINNSGSMMLPDGLLIPAEGYLVFTDSGQLAAQSDGFFELPGFRSFNNSGDQVVLKNRDGVLIDSLYYRSSWAESLPGISLERKDPDALSVDPHNWDLSHSVNGSTPGEQNSRFEPDEAPPKIEFVNSFHPDSIEVVFNKFVNLQGIQTGLAEMRAINIIPAASENESIQHSRFLVNGTEVDVLKYDPSIGNRIVLDGSGVDRSEKISIEILHLRDFQNNSLEAWDGLVAMPVEPGDLLFNEIMYQPIADNHNGLPDQSEYLEFINIRPYPVSLEGIYLHDEPDNQGNVVKMFPVSTLQKSIPANGFLLIYPENTTNRFNDSRTARFFDLFEHDDEDEWVTFRIDRNSLSLPNAGRAIYLADSTHRVLDRVHYSPDWHNPNLIDTWGISLERISTTLDTDSPDNWSSSANTLGGTPARVNSLFQHPGARNEKVGITVEPNPFSPDGDGFEDHLFIHYRLDEPDYLIRIRIFDRYGRLVRNLVNGEAAGFEGTRIWDGRMDSGQNNRIGIYIILFNAFDSANGRNLQFRETVVIARQF